MLLSYSLLSDAGSSLTMKKFGGPVSRTASKEPQTASALNSNRHTPSSDMSVRISSGMPFHLQSGAGNAILKALLLTDPVT